MGQINFLVDVGRREAKNGTTTKIKSKKRVKVTGKRERG